MTAATQEKPATLSNRGSLEPFIKDNVKFYEHQIECAREWWKKRSFILADDMGLGKSLQALTIYGMRLWMQQKKGKPLGHMLVVCPVSLKYNWLDEIEKFTGYQGMVLEGTPTKRRKQLEEYAALPTPKVLIVNYEQVISHLKELNDLEFDMVAADEAHYLKNHKSKRTKAYRGLNIKSHIMLTGTPLLNNPSELWVMLDRVMPTRWGTYYQFIRRYCNTPDAPIWMSDGSFKDLGSIVAGDKVMGWGRESDGTRRVRMESTVLEVRRRMAPRVIKVTMESGAIVKCTPDHRWLSKNHTGGSDLFSTIGLDPYDRRKGGMTHLSAVIKKPRELSHQEEIALSWLMGVYDGEGNGFFIAQSASYNPEIYFKICQVLTMIGIDFSMTPSGVRMKGGLQLAVNLLEWNKTFVKRKFFEDYIKHGIGRGKDGGKLGQFNRRPDKIVKIEELGSQEVISMQTTTGNYIAWGYASKNCAFGGYEGKQILGVKNEAELRQRMAPIMLRRLKKDVLDLPEVQIIRREVRLLPEQKKVYNEIVEEMRIQDADEDSAMGQTIDNPLTKYLRLKQVCGTLATVLGPDKDASAKLDAAIEDMDTFISNGEKVVVFTQFRGVLDAYSKRLEKQFPKVPLFYLHGGVDKDDRQNIAKAWAAVDGPSIILGTFPVMSVGLNLTAAKVMQFLDKDYVPAINQQAIDRCNRIGASTTQPIQVFEYIAAKTAEERIEQLLAQKVAINDAVIEKKTAPTFSADMMKLLEERAE